LLLIHIKVKAALIWLTESGDAVMWGNDYWLSLMVFAAIVCFGLAYAVRRARLMHCCDLDEHGHQVGPRAR